MELSKDQEKAAIQFKEFLKDATQTEMVISGRGGTGKTYLTQYLIDLHRQMNVLRRVINPKSKNREIYFTATTNKAAKVLSEATEEEATTIHTLLGIRPTINYTTGKEYLKRGKDSKIIQDSVIIIDEASMISSDLLEKIREGVINCKLLFIGDSFQLTPIFETTCPAFNDGISEAKLTEILRQVKDSPIIQLATKLRETVGGGDFPSLVMDGKIIQHLDGPEYKKQMVAAFTCPKHTNDSHKALAWSNARVGEYNDFIRGLHTNSPDFEVGESVVTNKPIMVNNQMMLRTEEIAKITGISHDTELGLKGWWVTLNGHIKTFLPESQKAVKSLLKAYAKDKDWVPMYSAKEFFADLRPVHACTIYKSQGSTYGTVFIDLSDIGRCNQPDTVARMLYVAVTRAKDKVVFYGSLPEKYQGT